MSTRARRAVETGVALLVSLFAGAAFWSWVAGWPTLELIAAESTPRPPEPWPWSPSPTALALVALLTLPLAATVWMQRKWERRIEPLALAALSLACLGHLAIARGALVLEANGDLVSRVELVDLGAIACKLAIGAGLIAALRILFDRARRTGLVFAVASVGCSAFALYLAGWLGLARFPAPEPADPALPVAAHARPDRCGAWDPEVAIVRVDAAGAVEVDGRLVSSGPDPWRGVHDALFRAAERMSKDEYGMVPDGVLCLRADRDAPAEVVLELLRRCTYKDVQIWKLHFCARWEEPVARTAFRAYLPKDVGTTCVSDTFVPSARLRLTPSDELWLLDDRVVLGRTALRAALAQVVHDGILRIEPSPASTWGEVLRILDDAPTPAEVDLESVELGLTVE